MTTGDTSLKRILVKKVSAADTVEIQWHLEGGKVYWERYSLPHEELRTKRIAEYPGSHGLDEKYA